MQGNIIIYIIVMAAVTYAVRALPLTLIRRRIDNGFVRSFLHYVPYATLAAMTFPAIFSSTAGGAVSACAGLVVAMALAFYNRSLIVTAAGGCAAVLIAELILMPVA